ncbi:MAG: ASCH domain-containing protein [Ferrimicrobium acidiphilum]
MTIKALTLYQPWASLVALGVKTIETRSWSTEYRGRLAIYAASSIPTDVRLNVLNQRVNGHNHHYEGGYTPILNALYNGGFESTSDLPLGAIVASCELIDVVPITRLGNDAGHTEYRVVDMPLFRGLHLLREKDEVVEDQRPYGDFTPGRYAWLLADIASTTERCPRCWESGSWTDATQCPACDAKLVCDPVSANGNRMLWEW